MIGTQKRVQSKCACGKRKSKYVAECNQCERETRAEYYAEAMKIVATGKCPKCGAGIHRNLSLSGWWQCDQYGAETHRKRADLPACSWQTFTES